MLIEQALIEPGRHDAQPRLSHSPGLTEDCVRELADWAPRPDALLDREGKHWSTDYFRLSCGRYCIARTTLLPTDPQHPDEKAAQTRALVVETEAFARFGNNPFAIWRAAAAVGAWRGYPLCVHPLEPLQLAGLSPTVDLPLLAHLARDPGPAAMATFVQAAIASDRLAVWSHLGAEELLSGLFSLLPVECRANFSFSTGLKIAQVPTVRIAALPNERQQWRAVAHHGATLLNLDLAELPSDVSWQGWPGFVSEVLQSGSLVPLASELEQSRPWLTQESLFFLGEQALANLREANTGERAIPTLHDIMHPDAMPHDDEPVADAKPHFSGASTLQRADASHVRPNRGNAALRDCSADSQVAELLAAQEPKVLELLERIDDLVFSAIAGDQQALAELEALWPLAVSELDETIIEQSREQYLRCALSICGQRAQDQLSRPERTVAAVDVLCVLFEE